MNILIIGNGGREHALAWKAAQSPLADKIFVAPGNAGTALEQKVENVNIAATDIPALVKFAQDNHIGLTIVGPEAPLVIGGVDAFRVAGLKIFGPTQAAAQLEGSKAFTKDFLARHKIPTAEYQNFTEVEPALAYSREKGAPIVVKADGLAAGKGVIVAMTLQEAEDAVRDMLSGNAFGEAGSRVVIEEFLDGEEASFIVMVDGKNVEPMATSQDHKRVGEKDTGLNTGGMGAYAPAPVMTKELDKIVYDTILLPVVKAMIKEGCPFKGCLYAGLMITKEGPKVVEFNCRFGDPETEAILPLLESDLAKIMLACTQGTLKKEKVEWKNACAVDIVLASEGYPATHSSGEEISGLEEAKKAGCLVFHAGSVKKKGRYFVNGGRVLNVAAVAPTLKEARDKAYEGVSKISWRGMQYRHDIADKGLKRLKKGK